jgi:hypothetical protein
MSRRFPPPWSIIERAESFAITDVCLRSKLFVRRSGSERY